jgi:hypothetical protein
MTEVAQVTLAGSCRGTMVALTAYIQDIEARTPAGTRLGEDWTEKS